jgi:hypothetical protein
MKKHKKDYLSGLPTERKLQARCLRDCISALWNGIDKNLELR